MNWLSVILIWNPINELFHSSTSCRSTRERMLRILVPDYGGPRLPKHVPLGVHSPGKQRQTVSPRAYGTTSREARYLVAICCNSVRNAAQHASQQIGRAH